MSRLVQLATLKNEKIILIGKMRKGRLEVLFV